MENGAMPTSNIIRVLIVDDHSDIRRALTTILRDYDDVQVVGEASTGEEAIASAGQLHPHVVVMDINLPAIDGITATRIIRSRFRDMAIVGISLAPEAYLIDAMLKAGGCGVIPKEKAASELYVTIHKAMASLTQSKTGAP